MIDYGCTSTVRLILIQSLLVASILKMSDIDFNFKILLVGDTGVGKSSIIMQYTTGDFDENLQSTIGVDFKSKIIDVEDGMGHMKHVNATLWDTAGQERFRTLTTSYYRGAHIAVVVYDVNRRDTFTNLNSWLEEIKLYKTLDLVIAVVGNKIDKPEIRQVTYDEGSAFAQENGLLFMEASAKTNVGIAQLFQETIRKVLDDVNLVSTTVPVRLGQRSFISSGCC